MSVIDTPPIPPSLIYCLAPCPVRLTPTPCSQTLARGKRIFELTASRTTDGVIPGDVAWYAGEPGDTVQLHTTAPHSRCSWLS
jgi:hypothetical protein